MISYVSSAFAGMTCHHSQLCNFHIMKQWLLHFPFLLTQAADFVSGKSPKQSTLHFKRV